MNTILLGNLIKIRWIAIFGQLSTIIFVSLILKINIPFLEAFLTILLSIAINLYSYLIEKKSKTISNIQAFLFLSFDTIQLGILLFLTGGIINPFSILIIAPVTVSYTHLTLPTTVIV